MQSSLLIRPSSLLKFKIDRYLCNFETKQNVFIAIRAITMMHSLPALNQFHQSTRKPIASSSTNHDRRALILHYYHKDYSRLNNQYSTVNRRWYCSNSSKPEKDDDLFTRLSNGNNSEYVDGQLPTKVAVPEVWPHVPIISVSRNPIFPRFMKILEVG